MAIRVRTVEGRLVALCAARSVEKPDDLYLDDAVHMALARKFWMDYPTAGPVPESWFAELTEREESNNPNRAWWDSEYAEPGAIRKPFAKLRQMLKDALIRPGATARRYHPPEAR